MRGPAPLLLLGLCFLAACEVTGKTAATPTPSPVHTPYSFPAKYSPSPLTVRTNPTATSLAAGRPDACALLTANDVQTAIAEAPDKPVMRDLGNVVRCTWANPDKSRIIYVEVFARTSQDARAARAMYDQNHRVVAHPAEVSGVADAAFTARYYAFALKGNAVLKVTYQQPHYPDIDPTVLSALVTAAGGRLTSN